MNFLKLYHQSDNIEPLHVKALNCVYVIACDNSSNPSSSASRLIVSAGSDLYSGLISGIDGFKGSFYGGSLY